MNPRQPAERLRQLIAARHARALDEDRDQPDVGPCQRGCDFEPYVVVGEREATRSCGINRADPVAPDEREKDAAFTKAPLDGGDEVLSRLDGVEIAKHSVIAEPTREPFIQASGIPGGIVAPVAEEDGAHRLRAYGRSAWSGARRRLGAVSGVTLA